MSAAPRCVAAAVAVGALAAISPAAADAHDSNGWYWTERKADRRVMKSYSDISSCDCIGWGPTKTSRRGVVRYSHFSCSMVLEDGTWVLPTLEVLGRKKARMRYGDAVDIIRGPRG